MGQRIAIMMGNLLGKSAKRGSKGRKLWIGAQPFPKELKTSKEQAN
ncbi:hypothetical protein [Paenibacillus agilis]|nr:hypothetical protein [Paenibacillus agilis]